LEFLARTIRQDQEIKWTHIGKEEVKLSLFADDFTLYLRDPQNSTKILLEIINSFSKVAGYKIKILKSVPFLYINNTHTEKQMRETIPFTIQYLKREIEEDIKRWKELLCLWIARINIMIL
jgi:hypothetical protein